MLIFHFKNFILVHWTMSSSFSWNSSQPKQDFWQDDTTYLCCGWARMEWEWWRNSKQRHDENMTSSNDELTTYIITCLISWLPPHFYMPPHNFQCVPDTSQTLFLAPRFCANPIDSSHFLRISGWDPRRGNTVTSHNTHEPLLMSFQPVLDPGNQFCHIHMTFEIPRTKFPCSNLVFINSWPWTYFIVKSHLLFSSDPATMCSLFMYILCFHLHLVYPWPCIYCTSIFPN